jgi:molybdopterin synthase catalytic subunit
VALRDSPLDINEVYDAVSDAAAGGIAMFVGTVRDNDSGRAVEMLGYTAHPSALESLQAVAERVAAERGAVAIAAVHRVGDLGLGEIAVMVAAACAHREAAFDVCRQLIDDLKATVPIWKHQRFTDGTEEWVGSP